MPNTIAIVEVWYRFPVNTKVTTAKIIVTIARVFRIDRLLLAISMLKRIPTAFFWITFFCC